ncbi:glutathione S-transferase family protein [Rhizobium halophytocola]|uniref:Glutathione S-transferase n=1 Tax=Rhizobium halophytocola TaxID=735519 RepID=A0ABS4E651_9HYPH|nr:glutathione S-transferase N-terminal domain-containing protein [Rhizobium halophytocola]MBP1853420.1 glutathione S-transferase [Rhizobium halophytocola]
MILRTTLTSPFGRKTRIAARLLGLERMITILPADTLDEDDSLRRQNPLGKMPTLILADGRILFDSRVILDYFDSLAPAHRLAPADGLDRYLALTAATMADGIADAGLLMVYEGRFREAEKISERWLAHQRSKIFRALEVFVRELPDPARTDLVTISLACALGYLDWRKPVAWRDAYPEIAAWLDAFADHEPAFNATARPEDT